MTAETAGPFAPPPSPREGDLPPVAEGYERAAPGTAARLLASSAVASTRDVERIKEIAAECAADLEALALEVQISMFGSDAERYAEMVCDEFTGLQDKGSCSYGYGRLIHFLEALLAEARERYDPTNATEGE